MEAAHLTTPSVLLSHVRAQLVLSVEKRAIIQRSTVRSQLPGLLELKYLN